MPRQAALSSFAERVKEKFSTLVAGEPEDQLRAPFELLLRDAAAELGIYDVIPVGETTLDDNLGRPDYSVTRHRLSYGHVELKAPGKGADVTHFAGHDKEQWARFSNLPNILYSDGREFSLYRTGKRIRYLSLPRDPRTVGDAAVDTGIQSQFAVLLRDFLEWEPIVPRSAKQLAEYLAPLCRNLRDDVMDGLKKHIAAVEAAAKDWRRYLFPGADDARFADAYAQTVTFSLLLARSSGSDSLSIEESVRSLSHANSLLSRALQALTDQQVKEHLGSTLDVLMRVISKVPTGTMSGGRSDPWLNFYEDFLAEYDPDLRRDAGAYYTPVQVVKAQVCIVDQLLREKFGKQFGFATDDVNVLDPAVGTGTYLLGVIEHALGEMEKTEGPGSLAERARVLGGSLYGFEYMVGPYAVASLRLTRMLQQYDGNIPAAGVQIILNNTLESPHEVAPELPLFYQPIGVEHERAKHVKENVPVLVCLGNPPYDRHEAATQENQALTGGWVRWGDAKDGSDAILNAFIAPVKAADKGGALKNLYNLYVYFWRWALWKTFERDSAGRPGIVSYITASSYLDGSAFLGMREHMRRMCDEIWIVDLAGDGRGARQDENVFEIQTPVAIAVAVRYGAGNQETPAQVHYTRIEGTRAAKLSQLESLQSLADLEFQSVPSAWGAAFRPAGDGRYFDWPLLKDLMPWQQSGVQVKRTWPIGTTEAVLRERWRRLLISPDRRTVFKETRDRKIGKSVDSLIGTHRLVALDKLSHDAQPEAIARYGYRSFDRQFVIADNRVGDYFRPSLWLAHSERQTYLASILTKTLGKGPALVATADVPDMDYFSGRGAKDIIPLYRDPDATRPNLHPELLPKLSNAYRRDVSAEEFVAYLYGLLAQPAFSERFAKELGSRELRVPVTSDAVLFFQVAELGRELLRLHTYGERFQTRQEKVPNVTKCMKGVPSSKLPRSFRYDEGKKTIFVDAGEFGPVAKAVWDYEVSGLKVVQSWLGYRLANRKGKKTSPLDDITPTGWSCAFTTEFLELLNLLDRTVALHPCQARLLEAVIAGPVLHEFSPVPPKFRDAPNNAKQSAEQSTLTL
ncbi:MAG: type ISP restriction/modification enzyme [Candidatus Polarisedimenticolia bacterium]|nr:N-6 DNA methylase [bacterium]